jgi:amino acid adenylation domain-containing protein
LTVNAHDEAVHPSSLSQQRLWSVAQLGRTGVEFILPVACVLSGPLDVSCLSSAVAAVANRQPSLRTTFRIVGDELRQVVRSDMSIPVVYECLEQLDDPEESALAAMTAAVNEPFDLVAGPVARVYVYRLGSERHAFLVNMHHIATDGISMEIFFDDLAAAYSEALRGHAASSEAGISYSYADYAVWQRHQLASGTWDHQLEYWRSELSADPPQLHLPVDRPRTSYHDLRGSWVSFSLDQPVREAVQTIARDGRVTEFSVLFAVYAVLMSRWCVQSDLIIGTPVANRALPQVERLVGFFINLLPIRTAINEAAPFAACIPQVHERLLDAYEHQDIPFDKIVDDIAPARTSFSSPLIQATFARELPIEVRLDHTVAQLIDIRPRVSRYDVALDYWPSADGGYSCDFYYAEDIFDRQSAADFCAHFETLLRAVTSSSPDVPLGAVGTASEPETSRLLSVAQRQRNVSSSPTDLLARLRAVVDSDPTGTAVIDGGHRLTFADLAAQSDAVASSLRAAHPNVSVVGICLPRTAALPVAILGAMKAAATFALLDPTLPSARLERMIRDAGCGVVLTTNDTCADLKGAGVPLWTHWPESAGADAEFKSAPGQAAAYVVFTSGSTGRPKGVSISNDALGAFASGLEVALGKETRRVVGWAASVGFDASVQQWVRLFHGDTIVVLPDSVRRDPEALESAIAGFGIQDLDMTPTTLELIAPYLSRKHHSGLRLLVGGEGFTPDAWSTARKLSTHGITVLNMYGLSECTVDSLIADVSHQGNEPVVVEALAGTVAYVLDDWYRLVPFGGRGQLFVAGSGVGLGYVGQPGLTSTRFVPDPYACDGSRMYATGDVATWSEDGVFRVLGRLDRQVKIRGYRIEPQEIEEVLTQASGCRVVVAMRDDLPTGTGLAAYFTGSVDVDVLRKAAAEQLPQYMLPSSYCALPEFPTNQAGKLDMAALPAPTSPAIGSAEETRRLSATEQLVMGIWTDVLGTPASLEDDFFALGGHSILAIRVVARVKRAIGVAVPMNIVFEHPRLVDLALAIDAILSGLLANQRT